MRADRNIRATLALVLIPGIAFLLYFQGLQAVSSAARRVGFLPAESPGGLRVGALQPGLPAERAGLRRNDLIVAVDGRAIDGDLSYQRVARAARKSLLVPLDDPGIEALMRSPRPLSAAQLARRSPTLAHRLAGLAPSSLAVPLLRNDRLIGALVVGDKAGGQGYPSEEQDLLTLLAHHVASVFENARLFESATYESLTGLLRREAILEQLERELERALRYGRPLTLAMADLDYFKGVNDRYGHLAGDTLLKAIAQTVAAGMRSADLIGRYGGEEFLLVLPETDIAGAASVAEKIRNLVQKTAVPMDDGSLLRVTISIGLAAVSDHEKPTARHLIAAADRSLYEAKNSGRNRVYPLVA